MSLLLIQLLSGLANAMFLFLVASGLSLIFGVTRIVNFAHGSFYMLAAYLTYTLVGLLPLGPVSFYAGALFAAGRGAPRLIAGVGGPWAMAELAQPANSSVRQPAQRRRMAVPP